MIRMKLDKLKSYFKPELVERAADRAAFQSLRKFGSFVRRTAKTSIKAAGKRRQVSRPGQPPRSITGLLKRLIFFIIEPEKQNVVIGPALANSKSNVRNDGTIPETLERGGRVTFLARKKRKARTVTIAPRPFMGPAMEKELPKWKGIWADSIK